VVVSRVCLGEEVGECRSSACLPVWGGVAGVRVCHGWGQGGGGARTGGRGKALLRVVIGHDDETIKEGCTAWTAICWEITQQTGENRMEINRHRSNVRIDDY